MLLLSILACVVAACGHEKLDFELPDAGSGGDQRSARAGMPATSTGVTASCDDTVDPAAIIGDSPQQGLDAASLSTAGRAGAPAAIDAGAALSDADHHQLDPHGYPTAPMQITVACMRGQSFPEVCANDLDDDCDGMVDEYEGIGATCRTGCGEGTYACSASTNALVCLGCTNDVPPPCGDGLLNSDEECDPNAPSEMPGITCTPTCTRPLFVHCVQAGIAFPDRCPDLRVCNERIGACVPVIGPQQRRCPQLPIEGNSAAGAYYPMLEVESGECWVTCSESAQCPSSLSECYMGFCVVPF